MTTKKKKSDYTPRPDIDLEVDPEVLRRLEVISRVMSGQTTVSDAAKELDLSRNRFQTIYHRGLGAMMEELEVKPGGRPAKDPRIAELEEENRRLQAEVRSLTIQLDVSRRATMNLAEMVREQHSIGRGRSQRKKATKGAETSDDDDEEDRRTILCEARRMIDAGMSEDVAAKAVATPASTLRRWHSNHRNGKRLAARRGPSPRVAIDENNAKAAAKRVRDTRGNIGAAALGKAIGIPRRLAAKVKASTLTAMERERRQAASRVELTTPAVMRGFDQMYVRTFGGWRFALVSADAAIPYRTSAYAADAYTSDEVLRALELDYALNGAPLVERLDRAAVHRTPELIEFFKSNDVLVLHGPPRCPGYYGQLERQNREHRSWLAHSNIVDTEHLSAELTEMTRCLNELIPRRSIDWCTPAERWSQRAPLQIDREAFRDEVSERAAKIAETLSPEELKLGFDQRFAIERTLMAHGVLRVTTEGWC